MPDLKQSLHDLDHGHLRIVAEHWGIELTERVARSVLDELVEIMLDDDLAKEVFETLPEKTFDTLIVLHEKQGRMPWAQFTRSFGQVREMGPGRRDRERPDQDPVSIAETLWYRALVGRAFFDTSRGAEEFAYIPTDLHAIIRRVFIERGQSSAGVSAGVLGRPATTSERAFPIPANDAIIDHACTLLAGLRVGVAGADFGSVSQDFIKALITHAGVLDINGIPDPEKTRIFLEAPRAAALTNLVQTWKNTAEHNDLIHVPGFQVEGEWQNDPLETRVFLLGLISVVPKDTWWSISAFLADVYQHHPDFQRPAGDYDSWFIKDKQTGEYRRGFENWFEVDGALIRYIITGPLHWLGITDIALPENDLPESAFKLSKWADDLLAGIPPEDFAEENQPVHVRSDGRVSAPTLVPRAIRYQLARFCTWETGNIHEYRYRLTTSSLTRAREAGLRITYLVSLLKRHAESIPPNILTALDRWDKGGTQVRMQTATVLRLGSLDILTALRSSRAARFLGDPLSPTTIIVKDGAEEKVLGILVEMGYFGEFIGDI